MRRFAFLAATAIILLAASHPALAESITVTDGFLEHNSRRDVTFELRSETHTLSYSMSGIFSIGRETAFPIGTTQTPTAQALIGGPGAIIVNGIAFPPPNPFPFGTFDFSVGPLIVPTSVPFATIRDVPFTFAGNLNAVNPQGNVLDLSLTGQGLSTISFDLSPRTAGFITKMSFSFTDSTGGGPVIPEPSTVLLVASGLAGLGLWRGQRNQ